MRRQTTPDMLLQVVRRLRRAAANIAGIQIFNEAIVSEINRRGKLGIETAKK